MQDASPLTGMFLMYLLMSAVHLGPWLKLKNVRLLVSRVAAREHALDALAGVLRLRRKAAMGPRNSRNWVERMMA
jgi:hypothetical protein